MYWPFPFANQTSKEVHHAGIEGLARTPTANVRNGLRLESHPVSKPLQAIPRINQANMFCHVSLTTTTPLSYFVIICHHMSMYWPFPFANQTSKEVHHADIESLARTPTANVRNGLRLESHPVSKPLQAIPRINQANMFSHVALTTTRHLSYFVIICHHMSMYWPFPFANQTSKEVHHAGIESLTRTPTANVRNGLRLESHPVSKPLQAIPCINQANMFSHVALTTTRHLSYFVIICHHMSMYWPFPFANQTSKEVHHAGIESLTRTPTANVRNGLRLESHPVSKPLQAIPRINQANMFCHVSLTTTRHLSYFVIICHHMSMYWPFPFANQTSKEVHHAGIESLARTPTANVRNGLRLESHPVSKPLQAIPCINQANMFSHVALTTTRHLSYFVIICHHMSMYWPFPFANQTSKEVHHAGIESLTRTPTANVRNGLRLESHPVSKPLQAIPRINQANMFCHVSLTTTRHLSYFVIICHQMSMYWPFPFANQTSKEVHHAGIESLARTPTANVRNGLRLESHPVSKPLQAIPCINQANMFSHVALTTTTPLSYFVIICHHMSMYWPSPFANQTSKEVHHAGIESLTRTPTANVRNGLRLESHPVSKPLQAIPRINQANMFCHVSLTTTTPLSYFVIICHHMSMYWPFPFANQTSKEVHHADIESLARTPTANVRNGLRLESHPVSKLLQAIPRINQANMFSHVALTTTRHLSYFVIICHHMSMYWPFPFANQTSKEVHHAGIESLARTPTANVRNGLRLESHPVSKPLQAIPRINQANMFSHVALTTTRHLSYFVIICHHMSMYWPFPFANQTSKEVHHAGIEGLARTPTANVRNGLRLESHPVSKPLQAIPCINQANMFCHVSLTTTTHLSYFVIICHHMSMYWPFPFANQTSKEVHHAGIESLARTPTANVRNGLRLESHPVNKPLQAIPRINQANMFCHVSLTTTTPLSYFVIICHHMSMYWPFPFANQTSKEVHHADIESLARTPTANVRNGLRLESHPVSKPLQAIPRINQANMFSHVALTTTRHLSYFVIICHHMSMYWPFPFANQTSKEVHHAGIESLARTPTANVRNGLRLESHPVSKPLQAIPRINQANMFCHVSLTTTTHLSYFVIICHHMSMYWPFPFANQTSKEVHHAGIQGLARTPTANVRNGLRLESHPVSKPLQAIPCINQANMFCRVSLTTTTHLSYFVIICHQMSMYWPFPFANQTSKEVHHAGIESLARTPTANVRNGLRLESHPVSKPLQAIPRINQANMFCHVSLTTTTPLSYCVIICHHMSMYWPFPFANQTSKEVHHAGIEGLARTPTANVRNGLRLESHPVSKPLQAIPRINQANMFSHVALTTTRHLSYFVIICHHMSMYWPFPFANQTSKEVHHAGIESLTRTPTANVRNGLRLESHPVSKPLQAIPRINQANMFSHVALTTTTPLSYFGIICHHMSMYWPFPFANQTSKEVHHAGIESLARTPTANVRNGLRLESHPVSKPLQAIPRINRANMFSHVALTTTTPLSYFVIICHHMSMYWPFPFANQTSKEVHYATSVDSPCLSCCREVSPECCQHPHVISIFWCVEDEGHPQNLRMIAFHRMGSTTLSECFKLTGAKRSKRGNGMNCEQLNSYASPTPYIGHHAAELLQSWDPLVNIQKTLENGYEELI